MITQGIKQLKKMDLKRTHFFLCDLQEKFREIIYAYPDVIKTAQKMIEVHQILDIPLIVTEQNSNKLGKIVAELDVSKAKIVQDKMRFSMCTDEVSKLVQKDDFVVLFGIESHVCVLQTALELLRNNINVYIIADGVSSCSKFEIPLALKRMQNSGCTIATSDQLLFELLVDASHPKFKDISAVVKKYFSKNGNDLWPIISSNI